MTKPPHMPASPGDHPGGILLNPESVDEDVARMARVVALLVAITPDHVLNALRPEGMQLVNDFFDWLGEEGIV